MAESAVAMRRLSELMRRVYSSTDTEGILDEIVHGVVEVLGYGVAAIARLEGDHLVMTHVAGPADVRRQLLGRRTPSEQILDEFRQADRWGILRYVPAGRMSPERLQAAWIPDIDPLDVDDAWHPEDALYAPLYSADGELLGNMAVDLPPRGRVPGALDRELLEMFVVQAGLALSNARDREQLTARLWLGDMLRKIAIAGSLNSMEEVLHSSALALAEGMGTCQVTVRCFADRSSAPGLVVGHPRPVDPEQIIPGLRLDLTDGGLVTHPMTVDLEHPPGPPLVRSGRYLQRVIREAGGDWGVVCPVSSSEDLLGHAVLSFTGERPRLTADEYLALAEVGRELGRIVGHSRVLETEKRLVEELRALARYRSELIATISHELKTPLTAIMGHAELVAERHPDSGSLEAISRNAERLNRLVGNLLEYSRVQGRRESAQHRVDVAELAAASVDLLGIRAGQSGVSLAFDHPGEPVIVVGDPEELGRVLDNMVDNAVKYTQAGGTVEVRLCKEDDRAVIEVCDTGLGISPFDLSHLFSPFHRSTNPDALSIPGTGLGLAISQRIAHTHGGHIEVESQLGEGSTFRFNLPLRAESPPAP